MLHISFSRAGVLHIQVTSQTPQSPAQCEVVCLFQLAEWGVLHVQVTSQTPWILAQFEVMCCVLFQLAEQGFCTGHEPNTMGLSLM